MAERILLVDDDADFRFSVRKLLASMSFEVEEASSSDAALRALTGDRFDAALVDLHMPPDDGFTVLRGAAGVATRIIVLTGHGSVDAAVRAMKLGALSFLEKPVDGTVLRSLVKQATQETQRVRGASPTDFAPPIVGSSAAITAVRSFLERVGPTDETVTIYGETGAGKEVFARHVHLASRRARERFVALNAATVPRELFESELFGHRRGAFTGATSDRVGLFREADGGTLFIDEVGELPLDSQAKLLRALEERRVRGVGETREVPVDVRIVAATNRDLWAEVEAGRFREDLYFRLQVFPIRIPALRERAGDIGVLAAHLLERTGSTARKLDASALDALERHRWPGNVRELLNVLRRASLFATSELLDGVLIEQMIAASIFAAPTGTRRVSELARPAPVERAVPRDEPVAPPDEAAPMSLADLERKHIERTLARNAGNVTKAAIQLGIDRRTLQRKLKSYGLAVPDDT